MRLGLRRAIRAVWDRWLGLVAGVRLFLDPNRLPDVFVIERALITKAAQARTGARLRANPATAAALVAQKRLLPLDLERLAAYAEGTVGRAAADFFEKRGLDPKAIPRLESATEAERDPAQDEATDYVRAHLYETHDLWHVLTGLDTDVAGELALQAFYSAQVDAMLPRILIVLGLINSRLGMGGGDDWRPRLDGVARGWLLGRNAKPLFGIDWDSIWDRPLAEVRRELGIAAISTVAEP